MARGFRFRLEVVQRIRRRAVDARKRDVAAAVRSVTEVEGKLAQTDQEIRDLAMISRDTKQNAVLDVASLSRQQQHRGWLAKRTAELQSTLKERRRVLDGEREKLAEASRQLKVIENLRERQWKAFCTDRDRREQMALDEAALQAFGRSSQPDQSVS